jgi:hypothetical protein
MLARLLAVVVLLTGLSTSASAAPCAGFTDVDDSSGFCTSIAWMKNRAITLGCTATQYCPSDFVRRDQMAAFMYRLGFQNTFLTGGNAFGATAVLGTTDDQPLDIRVNGSRVMLYEPNAVSPNVIGGNPNNVIDAGVRGATIGGGGVASGESDPDFIGEGPNRVTDHYGTVGGGYNNRAGNGSGSPASNAFATVGGGFNNTASGSGSAIGGGYENAASGVAGTVAGGQGSSASGDASTVAGGQNNTASGYSSTVAGGQANRASGANSTVAGGADNAASGDFSFAAGYRARATTTGTFIWADSRDFNFQPSVPNFFGVRATGGAGITVAIDGVTGAVTQYCNLLPGVASWQCVSDRDAKENFAAVDGRDTLARLAAMPLSSWNFKGSDPALRMLGPTAQDFYAAFGLGSDDKTIATVNLDGVALAAIQGLNAKVDSAVAAKDVEIAALEERLAKVEASHAREIDELRMAIEVLMVRMSTEKRVAQAR